jgi:hypothetical protein
MVCWWSRRRGVELRRKDVNNWLRNTSASTVSAEEAHQQKEEAQHVAAVLAREGATIVHEQQWGLSSAHSTPDISVVNDSHDYHLDAGECQLSDYEFRKEGDDGGGHCVERSGSRASSAGGRVTGSSSGPSGSMDLSIQL